MTKSLIHSLDKTTLMPLSGEPTNENTTFYALERKMGFSLPEIYSALRAEYDHIQKREHRRYNRYVKPIK